MSHLTQYCDVYKYHFFRHDTGRIDAGAVADLTFYYLRDVLYLASKSYYHG